MQPFAGNLRDAWRAHADEWAAWATTPVHDFFLSRYTLPPFLQIFRDPPASVPTLDIGCGEGRVSRAMAGYGHAMLGIDAASPLVRRAASADPSLPVALADAVALPFRRG